MADKYIIHGAAFNGDGTSSAEATSNGGVGAWNNINILTGTTPAYGTLAAGDVVYIRSKTSAGANITIAPGAADINIGSASANVNEPISWILDAGSKWSGISGTLTFSLNSDRVATLRSYNWLEGSVEDQIVFTQATATGSSYPFLTMAAGYNAIKNVKFDLSNVTSFGRPLNAPSEGSAHIENAHWYVPNSFSASVLVGGSQYRAMTMVNPKFNLAGGTFSTAVFGNFSHLRAFGGEIFGPAATTGAKVFGLLSGAYTAELLGLRWPKEMTFITGYATGDYDNGFFASSIACDDNLGAVYADRAGSLSSRRDLNFPTLNAVLPDSGSTPWSWLLNPENRPSRGFPAKVVASKFYTGTAGQKTVTFELLVADGYALTKANTWMSVVYIDNSTGRAAHTLSTLSDASLDSSTASWSATTYGAVSFTKHKLSLQTPTAIKQNTLVVASLFCAKKTDNANQFAFVCPDVQLS